MKRLLLFSMLMLSVVSGFCTETIEEDIILYCNGQPLDTRIDRGHRSINVYPQVHYADCMIKIKANVTIENVHIIVTNSANEIVNETYLTLTETNSYIKLPLSDEEETYTLKIEYGTITLYGYIII